MNLTPEQITENWAKLLKVIDTYITGERKDKLLALYKRHEERIATMPASGVVHYHSAFLGGYVDHVLRVVQFALEEKDLWEKNGATIDYTTEELVFAAINHDLGKMGSEDEPLYVPNQSEWHRKNQGKEFENNNKVPKMSVPDRGLFLLQADGIAVTYNEYISIKIHDGAWDEANKYYFGGHNEWTKLRTNLPYVLHNADMRASRIEFEIWFAQERAHKLDKNAPKPTTKTKTADNGNIPSENAKALFDKLFVD